ncbi:insulin-like growth factor binding protein [Anaeramoeba flamelloides]|uniref:Insulin-like growth factor binding protein n=1 Tax=Anaeramoeba flamelloides TaxID=1746091 RepID=A0ABQ8XI79_9EUKA|nr:insulin-like growth factor binding protein [Anaeramoeba flamelloides]
MKIALFLLAFLSLLCTLALATDIRPGYLQEAFLNEDSLMANSEQPLNYQFEDSTINSHYTYPTIIVPNVGQADERIKFVGTTFGIGTWHFTNNSVVYTQNDEGIEFTLNNPEYEHSLNSLEAKNILQEKTTHFLGSKKYEDIPNYETLLYKGISKGVDLEYTITDHKLKSTYYLDKGYKINSLSIGINLSQNIYAQINKYNGRIEFRLRTTNGLVLSETAPIFFQNSKQLDGEYLLDETNMKLKFIINDPKFDLNKPLIIDPTYATYISGTELDNGMDMIFDPQGCVIVTGYTSSNDFPTTSNVHESTFPGGLYSGFLFKMCDGKKLEWSTFIGSSSGKDVLYRITKYSNEDLLVVGYTNHYRGTDHYPTTSGVYKEECPDVGTVYQVLLTKVSSDGKSIVWSTLICAAAEIYAHGLTFNDDESKIFFAGKAYPNANIPPIGETGGDYDCSNSWSAEYNGYIASIASNGAGPLLQSYCLDVSDSRNHFSKLIYDSGYVYMIGVCLGDTHSVYGNCYRSLTESANSNWIFGRIDEETFNWDWLCQMGDSVTEMPSDQIIDNDGNLWVVGFSQSKNFPTTSDAFQEAYDQDSRWLGTFSKFTPDGANLLYSSYIYSPNDQQSGVGTRVRAIAIGKNNEVVISVQRITNTNDTNTYDYGKSSVVYVFPPEIGDEPIYKIKMGGSQTYNILLYEGDIHNISLLAYYNLDDTERAQTFYPTPGCYQNESKGGNDVLLVSLQNSCPKGFIGTTEGCQPCDKGYWSDEPMKHIIGCEMCDEGTFSNETGSTICDSCIMGTYQNSLGKSLCSLCGYGSFGNETQAVRCYDCGKGFFANEEGSTECGICKMGTYSDLDRSQQCTDCEPGFFNNDTAMSECYSCQQGEYSFYSKSTYCKKCKIGTYQNATGQSQCDDCLPGSYNSESGLTGCLECGIGTYSTSTQSNRCLNCSIGTYQDTEGNSHCEDCSMGSYNTEEGLSTCIACGVGTYSEKERANECLVCPKGTFNPNNGSHGIESCQLCPEGSYNIKTGSFDAGDCTLCGTGTWSGLMGAVSINTCQVCPKGTYSDTEGAVTKFTCLDCPDGYYNDEFGASGCKKCSKGNIPNKQRDRCESCPSGTFNENDGMTECTPCPEGYFNNKTQQTSCIKCISPELCIGEDKCQNGRNPDSICEQCVSGYFELNETCQKCPDSFQYLFFFIVIFIFLLTIFLLRKQLLKKVLRDPYPTKRIFYTFLQYFFALISFRLTWPESMTDTMLKWFAVLNFDFGIVASPQCIASIDWTGKWLIQLFIPFWFFFFMSIIFIIIVLKIRGHHEKLGKIRIFFYRLFSLSLKYFYLPMLYITLEPFSFTYSEASQKKVLQVDPSISSEDSKYRKLLPLYYFSLIFYGLGIPMFFLFIVVKAKRSNFSEFYVQRFGWVFINYKEKRYWFELCEITLKLLVVLSIVIFQDSNSMGKNIYLLILLISFATLVAILRPYKKDTFWEQGIFTAEERAQIGFFLMLIGLVTLAFQATKGILFFILWPIGAIIGFLGLYYSNLKRKELRKKQRVKKETQNELKLNENKLNELTLHEDHKLDHRESIKINNKLMSHVTTTFDNIKNLKDQIQDVTWKIGEFEKERIQLEKENKDLKRSLGIQINEENENSNQNINLSDNNDSNSEKNEN